MSPDGNKLVYAAGNENPQLAVVLVARSDQCCAPIFTSGQFP